MKVEYINPFLETTTKVIETMAFTKVTAGKPSVKPNNLTWGVVTGVIGLAGENVKGNMVLSFDEKSILSIVSKMLSEEFSEVSKDVIDAVGELTNMICGGAKSALSEKGFRFDMALPMMLVGKNMEITHLGAGPTISIPFTTESGKFVVEAAIYESK